MTAAIPQDDALRLLLAAIAGNEPAGGLVEVRWRRPQGGGMGQMFHSAGRGFAVVETITGLGRRADTYIGCAPRRHRHGGAAAIERIWTLWADLDGEASPSALETFDPAPSLVIRSGSGENRHAYWQLREPIETQHAKRALRRLAHALEADMAAAEPARILRPAGTLNHKSNPPAPVECVHLEPVSYLPADIVGHLPDPPNDRLRRTTPASVGGDDPLQRIAPAEYVARLTGREAGRDGKVCCPLPGHDDRTPSFQTYPTPERGWSCFGCGKGGTIIDFGAALFGVEPRGAGYHEIRRRLAAELLRGAA